jgi:hypothetical protein
LEKGNNDAALPLARLPQPPESLIFERNVQSGVNETSKKEVRVQVQGYREERQHAPTVTCPSALAGWLEMFRCKACETEE